MDFNEAYDDTNTSVGLAARLGNVVLLKELLQQGFPTNGHDNRGWRPLHEAAAAGHVECVRLLLAAEDADVDALSHEGLTALHLACEPDSCHTEVVKLLLCAGADPNMNCGDDWDLPLPKAVLNNLCDIVKLLLDAGGDPNRADYKTGVPLMAAAEKGHVKIAQLLVERGAKVDRKDDGGHSPIHFLLLPPYNLKEDSALIQFIDLLVDKGCDVNARMSDGTTPLMLAVQGNKEAVVTRLLELGADPNIEKDYGVLALHYAIEFCPDSSTGRHDSSTSEEDKNNDQILRRILDLTSRDLVIPEKLQKKRYSIFHLAVEWDKFNTLKLMVNAGLPPDAFLQETASAALDEADVHWLDETEVGLFCQVPMVIDLGMEVDTPLGFLLSKPLNEKRVEMAKFMIDTGSNVNSVVPGCLPPLVAAVKHQRARYNRGCPGLDILEHLLNNGVDVMHKIRESVVLPAALHISSLFNVNAFFAILVRCIPVHEIYTPRTLGALSQLYSSSSYYKVYPLFPWRVISWLTVVNALVPQLPLDTKNTFDIRRMVDDDNLSRAWDDLDAQIGSPKKLEQLCVLAIRQVVGERNGWARLTPSLRKLTLMNEPLPDLIMDLLLFRQMESSCLYKWPPRHALPKYVVSAASSNSNSDSNDDLSDNEEDIEVLLAQAMDDDDDDDDDGEDDDDDDDDDEEEEEEEEEEENEEDNSDKEDEANRAEDSERVGEAEQNDNSEEEESKRKKLKTGDK